MAAESLGPTFHLPYSNIAVILTQDYTGMVDTGAMAIVKLEGLAGFGVVTPLDNRLILPPVDWNRIGPQSGPLVDPQWQEELAAFYHQVLCLANQKLFQAVRFVHFPETDGAYSSNVIPVVINAIMHFEFTEARLKLMPCALQEVIVVVKNEAYADFQHIFNSLAPDIAKYNRVFMYKPRSWDTPPSVSESVTFDHIDFPEQTDMPLLVTNSEVTNQPDFAGPFEEAFPQGFYTESEERSPPDVSSSFPERLFQTVSGVRFRGIVPVGAAHETREQLKFGCVRHLTGCERAFGRVDLPHGGFILPMKTPLKEIIESEAGEPEGEVEGGREDVRSTFAFLFNGAEVLEAYMVLRDLSEDEHELPSVLRSSYYQEVTDPDGRVGETHITSVSDPAPHPHQEGDFCAICLAVPAEPRRLRLCGHTFCAQCLAMSLYHNGRCPQCTQWILAPFGNMPNGFMRVTGHTAYLPGYEGHSTIRILYCIHSGVQGEQHPHPWHQFEGTTRSAYLPACEEGLKVCRLLWVAFKHHLTFTVGRSLTSKRDDVVVWNDIHHKSSMCDGPTSYGYPDPDYLTRVTQELAAHGITEDFIKDMKLPF